ncbi:MAG: sn-glycerol-3-phosphate ABC transporter ATP-binding protein UgpC [Cytophagales bacterium]|nr:sn-glycerol-3-phosphate ABC transporter ATP-binding protein UgpC [Cytophagales bacterium]
MAHVELRQVGKSYDGLQDVIPNISLSIANGEFVVLVGPSGCGKSTLLRMIAGLETITRGDILIDEYRVNDEPPRHRDLAMVFQDYALYPHKTLFENMAFGLRLRKTPEAEIQTRVMNAAQLLKIDHMLERKPAALSGGQRQRVAIGRAIVRKPKVFLFDEPLSNLDAQLRGEMRTEIKKLHQRLGATIIYVTHDQVEAMTLADRIAIMKDGKVQQYGTPDEIYNNPTNMFVASFTGSPSMNLTAHTQLKHETQAAIMATKPELGAVSAWHMGIRPENILLQPPTHPHTAICATLQLMEPLGAETLLTVCVDDTEMMVRAPANFKSALGASLNVFLPTHQLHFFHSTSGDSL